MPHRRRRVFGADRFQVPCAGVVIGQPQPFFLSTDGPVGDVLKLRRPHRKIIGQQAEGDHDGPFSAPHPHQLRAAADRPFTGHGPHGDGGNPYILNLDRRDIFKRHTIKIDHPVHPLRSYVLYMSACCWASTRPKTFPFHTTCIPLKSGIFAPMALPMAP